MACEYFKVVTVKHQGCNIPYTFRVPENMTLDVGDFVMCKTKKHPVPQVGKCMTPSFRIGDFQLEELYQIKPQNLMPVVGILRPVMYAFEDVKSDG